MNNYLTGVDVSFWQGSIDWKKAKTAIDFAIIRAGYGAGNIDKRADENIKGCIKNKIPYGVYWFSYAYSVDTAKREAEYLLKFLNGRKPEYPIYWDFEGDSVSYARRKDVAVTPKLVCDMAEAFCSTIVNAGFVCGIYANPDFINRYFGNNLFDKYPLWLAKWGDEMGKYTAPLWQYTDKGFVSGISGNVDVNKCFAVYANKTENITKTAPEIAKEVIYGQWGNGEERKAKLTKAGYSYNAVQNVINNWYTIASQVIRGVWGNGEERKAKLTKAGYDYKVIQHIVNDMLGE